MVIKIFFGIKPLYLCDAIDPAVEPFVHHDDAVFIDELDPHTIKSMIHEMAQEKVHAGVFLHPDLGELKKAFFKKFTLVTAAGGLVTDEKSRVLLIFRRGKWDLPKGKLDEGESIEQCALREVSEETGLQNVQLISPLTTTYHTYHEGSKFLLKESHWYKMIARGSEELIPQTEEDIHEIKWVKKDEMEPLKNNSFPSIIDVLSAAGY